MTRRDAALLLLALASGGCATPPDDPTAPSIAPRLPFRLPSPASLGYTVAAHQLITAHFGGETYVFETEIAILADAMDLVGLDAFGRRALTLRWRDGTLSATRATWLPERIRPANILADIALTFWPTPVIATALAPAGARLEGDGRQRRVMRADDEIIRIDYEGDDASRWNGRIRYRNLALRYDLDIQSTAAV